MAEASKAPITGNFSMRVNGVSLPLIGSATIKGLGGKNRKPVVGNAYHGWQEEVVAAEVEVTITHKRGMNITDIANITDATIIVDADNGSTYTLAEAACAGALELSNEGQVKANFFGPEFEESAGSE